MAEQPAFATEWFRQRIAGAGAVAAIEAAELRDLSDADALRLADALLSAAPIEQMCEGRRASSGFVEQQRRFARGR